MSKKNSNVVLKNNFKDFEDLNKVYEKFEYKIQRLKKRKLILKDKIIFLKNKIEPDIIA